MLKDKKLLSGLFIGISFGIIIAAIPMVIMSLNYFNKPESKEFQEFQKKNGSKQIFFCNEAEFLVEKYFKHNEDIYPTLRLIKNGGDSPVHCMTLNKKNKDKDEK